MEQINQIKSKELPLKALLRLHDVRLWQIVKRCLSNGVYVRENELSRILDGIDQPSEQLKAQLERIEVELKKLNTPKEKMKKRLQSIKEELRTLEKEIDS